MVALRRLIRLHPTWGRTRISIAACELLNWRQPNGRLKDRAFRVAAIRLEKLGLIKLPEKLIERGGRPPTPMRSDRIVELQDVKHMPTTIELRLVQTPKEAKLWNALISEFHYLGLVTPVGRLIRYLAFGDDQLVGAISYTEPAWRLWQRDDVLAKLDLETPVCRDAVISNNRFLIMPSVQVPNLASRVLSASLRSVRTDWARRYSVAPLVAETFVDPRRFEGTCYLAANWLYLGQTRGYTKRGNQHIRGDAPKLLLLRGITPVVHKKLAQIIAGFKERAA